jgi:hypothetical protein
MFLQQTVAMGAFGIVDPQQSFPVPIKFTGVIFNAPGLYTFSLEINDQREPIAAPFNVQLLVPQSSPMSLPGRR